MGVGGSGRGELRDGLGGGAGVGGARAASQKWGVGERVMGLMKLHAPEGAVEMLVLIVITRPAGLESMS